jgi:hypothetical protein
MSIDLLSSWFKSQMVTDFDWHRGWFRWEEIGKNQKFTKWPGGCFATSFCGIASKCLFSRYYAEMPLLLFGNATTFSGTVKISEMLRNAITLSSKKYTPIIKLSLKLTTCIFQRIFKRYPRCNFVYIYNFFLHRLVYMQARTGWYRCKTNLKAREGNCQCYFLLQSFDEVKGNEILCVCFSCVCCKNKQAYTYSFGI